MRKRTSISDNARMMDDSQGAAYTGMGIRFFRDWSEKIGAVRYYNRRRVNDRAVIDAALDAMQPGERLESIDPHDKRYTHKKVNNETA